MNDDLRDLPEESASADSGAAAMALALDGAKDKPDVSEAIIAFLKEQRRLMEDQREQVRDQVKRIKLGLVDQRLSIALKLLTGLVGLILAGALAWLVWDSAGSGGLVIEPFSVPPDFATRGLTGEVVASKLLDRLVVMQNGTDSQRDPKTYANYWGDDIKVEIPSTGISISELERFLREKLGHPTHITGEIVAENGGVALTARAGTQGSSTVVGSGSKFHDLMQQLAESVYRLTQPYRYGVWLVEHDRRSEGVAVFAALKDSGAAGERPWGLLGWSNALEENEGIYARLDAVLDMYRRWPGQYLAAQNAAIIEDVLGHPEEAIALFRAGDPLLSDSQHGGIRASVVPVVRKRVRSYIDADLGAFHDAVPLWRDQIDFGPQGVTYSMHAMLARSEIGEHDLAAARATMAHPSEPGGVDRGDSEFEVAWMRIALLYTEGDWQGVVGKSDALLSPVYAHYPGVRTMAPSTTLPLVAFAQAKLGHFAAAEGVIARTPDDCDICLRIRARIAQLEGQHARADWWFARAVAENPAIPFAYTDWGKAKMGRGDYGGAIAKFAVAHAKGPHFAEPLEMWGEALMQENRSDLALAKFEEANKYAPNWGRLHLEWGKALSYGGRKGDAESQFTLASHLDLSRDDATVLSRWLGKGHERGKR
jgi:tetratricopeptide (TPR) repeat protein